MVRARSYATAATVGFPEARLISMTGRRNGVGLPKAVVSGRHLAILGEPSLGDPATDGQAQFQRGVQGGSVDPGLTAEPDLDRSAIH